MKKKLNGFVFMETIAALVVVSVALVATLSTFSLITRKTNAHLYYNQISDRYLLYSISHLGTDDNFDYSSLDNKKITASDCNLVMNEYDSVTKAITKKRIFPDEDTCKEFFKYTDLKSLYIVTTASNTFTNTIKDIVDDSSGDTKVENGTVDFLKTLETGQKYMVGVFFRNNNYYYASLRIG